HSLGVMQLAGNAWEKMQVNQTRLADTANKFADFRHREQSSTEQCHGVLAPTFTVMPQIFGSDYHLQVLRLVALLHDIGHPPFSHSGERFLPSWQAILEANPAMPPYLAEWFHHRIERLTAQGKNPRTETVRHEIYSLLFIDKIL